MSDSADSPRPDVPSTPDEGLAGDPGHSEPPPERFDSDPPRRVRKRDGREVPFDAERIIEAVQRAQEAVGEDDPPFPREVADVVRLALAVRFGSGAASSGGPASGAGLIQLPGVEEIQDLVEQALIEMGRARVAKAYILYRDRRARARDALRVSARPDRSGRMPWVRDGAGTSPWNPARIVAALMEEAELPEEVADEVASRVENRVFDSGLRRLSTSLVREFVDNELMAMGLEVALHRQEPVGVPRHDLRQLFARPVPVAAARPAADRWSGDDASLESAVGAEILGRFALADVFDERTADLHRGGALFIEDARRPHQVLARAVPAELLLRGAPDAHAGFGLLGDLASLLRSSTHGVVLEGLHALVAPFARGARGSGSLRDLCSAIGALGFAAGRRLDLASPGGRSGSLVRRLVPELAALTRQGLAAPRLFLSWEELAPALDADGTLPEAADERATHEGGASGASGASVASVASVASGGGALADEVEELLVAGGIVPVWHGKDDHWAAPGCRRRKRERGAIACAGAVALNLPRLARQAGPWREDVLFEALAARLQQALDALETLDRFQRQRRAVRADLLRERTGYAITPVGLVEALRILGDGELRPEQGARLLGLCAEATSRFAAERGLAVVLSPFFGDSARARFAQLDAKTARPRQPRLFADLPAPEEEHETRYSTGFALPQPGGPRGKSARPGAALAELCATVRAGALFPFQPLSEDGDRRPKLTAWHRFHEHRFPSTAADSPRPPRSSLAPGEAPNRPSGSTDPSPLFRTGLRPSCD